jgi:hypothetical protein
VERGERDIVARLHDLAFCEAKRISLDDFFGQGLWASGACLEGREDRWGIRIAGLRVEYILKSLRGGG